MPDNEVRLDIHTSFNVDGADETKERVRGVSEELQRMREAGVDMQDGMLEGIAPALQEIEQSATRASEAFDSMTQSAQSMPVVGGLGDGYQQAITPSQVGQAGAPQSESPVIEFGGYRGLLWEDIAQQALSADDHTTAARALFRATQVATDDRSHARIEQLQRRWNTTRAAQGFTPAAEMEPEDFIEDEDATGDPDQQRRTDRRRRDLYDRIDRRMTTIGGSMAAGRHDVADRQAAEAEHYLDQLRAIDGNTDELKELQKVLSATRETITEQNEIESQRTSDVLAAEPGDGSKIGNVLTEIRDQLTSTGLGGLGPAGGMLGRLGGLLGPSAPVLLGAGAAIGLPLALSAWSERAGADARHEALAYQDAGARLGYSDPMIYQFIDGNFASTQALRDVGYTSDDALRFMDAYGMPGHGAPGAAYGWPSYGETMRRFNDEELGSFYTDPIQAEQYLRNNPQDETFQNAQRARRTRDDVIAGLTLAGELGQDPGNIANLMRTGVQAGAFRVGEGEQFASAIYHAVLEGTKEGVSSAETFATMERHLALMASGGVTGSMDGLRAYAQLLSDMASTGSRSLQGAAGATAADNLVGHLTGEGYPGMEIMTLRALGVGQGGMQSAEEWGLDGPTALLYEELARGGNEIMAGRLLMEQAREGNNPYVRRAVMEHFAGLGMPAELEMLMFRDAGLSYEQYAGSRYAGDQRDPLMARTPQSGFALFAGRPEDVDAAGLITSEIDPDTGLPRGMVSPQAAASEYGLVQIGELLEELHVLKRDGERRSSLLATSFDDLVESIGRARDGFAELFGSARMNRLEHPLGWRMEHPIPEFFDDDADPSDGPYPFRWMNQLSDGLARSVLRGLLGPDAVPRRNERDAPTPEHPLEVPIEPSGGAYVPPADLGVLAASLYAHPSADVARDFTNKHGNTRTYYNSAGRTRSEIPIHPAFAETFGTDATSDEFRERVYNLIAERAALQGVTDVNIIAATAQAVLESSSGASGLARGFNNLFGVEWQRSSGWDGDVVNMAANLEGEERTFRAFDSPIDSIDNYFEVLRNGYYNEALQNADDPYRFIDGLGAWATDSKNQESLKREAAQIEQWLKNNPRHYQEIQERLYEEMEEDNGPWSSVKNFEKASGTAAGQLVQNTFHINFDGQNIGSAISSGDGEISGEFLSMLQDDMRKWGQVASFASPYSDQQRRG